MAYARADMDGVWSNQDIMKVSPDPDLIKPGYLYAYLCSRFGVPLIISGTYGAIIQHIEPQHIADLPVPRLGAVEDQAYELIQGAADLRVEAASCRVTAGQMVNDQFRLPGAGVVTPGRSTASSTLVLKRWRRPSTMLLLKKA